ncbi:MAG: hypothetical protein KA035_00590 [Candidatus Levybacteria bacterium]|nr:hypothetical protein [Candidatus Levybacteria bacterium]
MREHDQPHFAPADIPQNWQVPVYALPFHSINQIDTSSGFISISNSTELEPTREYFINEQGLPIDSIWKSTESISPYNLTFETSQTRGLIQTNMLVGSFTSYVGFSKLTDSEHDSNLGNITYLYDSQHYNIGKLYSIYFGDFLHPTDTNSVPLIYLQRDVNAAFEDVDAWKPDTITDEVSVEKIDSGNYLVTSRDKKEYALTWNVAGNHLLASFTDNETGASKLIEAAASFDRENVRDLFSVNAPYPKDEHGHLDVPWTRAINLAPARLVYLQPKPEQETPNKSDDQNI